MAKKRILIIDDDTDILFLLAHSVKRLAPDYEVCTAIDGKTGLVELEKQAFDLVLTDHMMPELTGIDLAARIKAKNPDTRIVLMTAYEPHRLDNVQDNKNIDAFVRKPFKIPNLLEVVQQFLVSADAPVDQDVNTPLPRHKKVWNALQDLWREAGADIVLLLSAGGRPLQSVGESDRTTITRLATFVADNFFAVTEFTSLLDDHKSTFKSSYHEGNRYNIYSHYVAKDYLLAVVFGSDKKPGPVWIYTKQTAALLASVFEDQ